jgi:hypothetical protein
MHALKAVPLQTRTTASHKITHGWVDGWTHKTSRQTSRFAPRGQAFQKCTNQFRQRCTLQGYACQSPPNMPTNAAVQGGGVRRIQHKHQEEQRWSGKLLAQPFRQLIYPDNGVGITSRGVSRPDEVRTAMAIRFDNNSYRIHPCLRKHPTPLIRCFPALEGLPHPLRQEPCPPFEEIRSQRLGRYEACMSTHKKRNGRTSLGLLAALLHVLRASLTCRFLSTRLWFSLPALDGRGRWSWGCARHFLLGRLLLWLVTRLTLHVRFGTCSSTARHRDPFHLCSTPFDLGPTFGNDICIFGFGFLRARDSLECAHHGPT